MVVAASFWAGCGDDDGGGGAGPPIEELGSSVADSICTFQVRCGVLPDAATCRRVSLGADLEAPQIVAAVNAGRVRYDRALAGQCLGLLRSADGCDLESIDGLEACDDVFSGTLADDAPCTVSEECIGGSCDFAECPGGEACCPGKCATDPPAAPIGGDCTDADCVSGAFCDFDDGAGTATCRAQVGLGAACDSARACREGFCVPTAMGSTCRQLPEEGDDCAEVPFCGRGDLYCDPTDSVCKKLPAVGDACIGGELCLPYAYCDAGTCRMRPVQGEACDDELRDCLGDLECVSDTCQTPPPDEVCP